MGGSQIGGRIAYRLNHDVKRPLSLSARLYAPVGDWRASEAAIGVEWQPVATLPARLLVEHRLPIGRDGRSALAAMAYGGVTRQAFAGKAEFDAYAQAGIVGTRSRDLFADGAAAVSLPLPASDKLRLGLGAWGAAQPGLSRVDIGPHLSLDLPVANRSVRVSASWRQRVAGNAAPASGPALILATDF